MQIFHNTTSKTWREEVELFHMKRDKRDNQLNEMYETWWEPELNIKKHNIDVEMYFGTIW